MQIYHCMSQVQCVNSVAVHNVK